MGRLLKIAGEIKMPKKTKKVPHTRLRAKEQEQRDLNTPGRPTGEIYEGDQ